MTKNKKIRSATAKPVVKEQLTDDVMKRLFGPDDKNVCVYNIESGILMTPYYNGQKVHWDNDDTANARQVKEYFEKDFPEFEVVAQVTKKVSNKDYPGWGKWTKGGVKFDKNGENTVVTLVIRNKKTGKLERLNGLAWFGASGPGLPNGAARYGANGAAFDGAGIAVFRAKFFAGMNIDRKEGLIKRWLANFRAKWVGRNR